MDHKTRTATEASAVVALAAAVSFSFGGAYIAAGIATLIGVLLFVLYERFGISSIELNEDEVEFVSSEGEELVEEALDEFEKNE